MFLRRTISHPCGVHLLREARGYIIIVVVVVGISSKSSSNGGGGSTPFAITSFTATCDSPTAIRGRDFSTNGSSTRCSQTTSFPNLLVRFAVPFSSTRFFSECVASTCSPTRNSLIRSPYECVCSTCFSPSALPSAASNRGYLPRS